MSKNNNKKMSGNKKFIIGSSIALLVIFGTVLGATYGITAASMEDPNYIKFYVHGKEYDINDLQPKSKTREGTSDNEFDANEIMNQFYSLSLFGTIDYEAATLTPDENVDYLLKGIDGINVPYVVKNDLDTYRKTFTEVKLFKDTLNKNVVEYLKSLDSDDEVIINMMDTLDPEAKYNDLDDDQVNDLIGALSKDQGYQKSILEEMFVYSYLWQESKSSRYDYKFTEALVESRPSMVAEMNINTDLANADSLDVFTGVTDTTRQITSEDWNKNLDAIGVDATKGTETNNAPIDGSFNGFKGVQFGTTDNSSIRNDYYRTTNTWDVETQNTVEGEIITSQGEFTNNDILKNANYYVASDLEGSKGKGALLYDGGDSYGDITGTATVTAYSQLYPYMFAQKAETIDGAEYYKNPTYSLFANIDGDKITSSTADDTSAEYIFNRWFKDNATQGEIYVAEAIMANDSSIKDQANDYWNDRGYYIELSGESSDNYLNLMPQGILKKED